MTLCFYTCLSVHRRGVVSQHALQVVSQHALQVSSGVYPSMPCRFPGPHPGGELEGLAGGSSGLYLGGGKLRSLAWGVSRPTPWGISRPTPWGCIPACTEADPPPMATAAGGTHPTGMYSCFISRFVYSNSG